MPRHIVVLTTLLVGLVVAGLAAKSYFTVASYYEFGHFRGNSVPEIASLTPQLKTSKYCAKCHDVNYTAWSDSVHKVVQCEVCHGAANGHPKQKRLAIAADPIRLCSQCHEAMPGRPAAIKQIDVAQHSGDQSCISCHSPHSPKPAVALAKVTGDVASGKQAAAAECANCHGADGIGADAAMPNLAGQTAPYLYKAIAHHPQAAKPDGTTVAVAQGLADQRMKDLAVYYASLDCAQPSKAAAGDAEAGKQRAELCIACHGVDGNGSNPAWPKLAAQKPGYLAAQLKAIKDGSRTVSVMADIAGGMSDADIANLASHYAGAACKARAAGSNAP